MINFACAITMAVERRVSADSADRGAYLFASSFTFEPAKRTAPVDERFARQRHGRRRRWYGQSPQRLIGVEVFELVLTQRVPVARVFYHLAAQSLDGLGNTARRARKARRRAS